MRHGLMQVGPTGGGKTTNYRVLKKAMSMLAPAKDDEPEVREKNQFRNVKNHILNPKSVTKEEL